jgi:2-polyprenyl-6-methoxyphenol hydroxylase-like FAD-dependent oxidoreductase
MLPVSASISTPNAYDAVILGGGLAGLTLARQLHLEAPHIRVLVVEKRKHPVREAAFKVGESSVEIGAHYLRVVLKLESHLRGGQLEKLGLRYFFPQGDNRDLARRVELGPPTFPPVPSFQLDRGRLENLLLAELRQSGVEVLDDCSVKQIALEPLNHMVAIETRDGQAREVRARWVVDASGRAGLIKRQLGLTRTADHGANACWFRVPERVMVDDWSAPGSDFIAIGNDCAADLIIRTARGEDVRDRAEAFDTNYLRLFEAFLRLYSGQYPLMGNAQVMTAKAAWDNGAYWAITGLLYFQRRFTRPEFMHSIDLLMRRFFVLHARMQQLFHAWDLADQRHYESASANVVNVEFLRHLQASLAAPAMDDETLRQKLEDNFTLLESFASTWQALASERNPSLQRFVAAGDRPLLDLSALVLQPVAAQSKRPFAGDQETRRTLTKELS